MTDMDILIQMENIRITKGSRDPEFESLRERYLDSLCEPIELYTQLLSRDADPHHIVHEGRRIGYFLLGTDRILREFYLADDFIPSADDIFRNFMSGLPVEKAVCQSWDHLFMSMCHLHFKDHKTIGYNFRDRIDPKEPIPDLDLVERTATLDDVDLMTSYSDGIFDENEIKDIPYWIERSECIIFENPEGVFIGYGMINRTVEGRNWFDIGMYVNPDHRRKGYGSYIIGRMAEICEENGCRPTAGCAFENIGSKKTLERAGFVSKHLIIEFRN
ncbi:MAG: GNAT family N-acetyltransferase [Thermoplasmatota archaeon]